MKLSLLVIVLAACGSPKPAPTTPPAEKGETGELDGAPPELVKFHDTLAPRWHAAKGPERMASTCGAIADFVSGADGVAKATPPAKGNASAWAQESKELTEAVAALKTVCEAKDAAKFEAAFAGVHQEFHELLEVASAHHEEHEGHDEPDHGKSGY